MVTGAFSTLDIGCMRKIDTQSNTNLIMSEGLGSFLSSFKSAGLIEFTALSASSK